MVKVATIAWAGSHDIELNVKNHLAWMEEAAAAGAKLVVFPEISLQGYPPDIDRFYPERLRAAFDNAESIPDGPHVSVIADRASELGIYAIYGMNERGTSAGVIYNTAVLTGPDGYVGKYRKVHVGITEQLTWRVGNDWPVFETELGRIGILICYDQMWPEAARELMLRGAEIIVMPTGWPMIWCKKTDPEENTMVRQYKMYGSVRAAENSRWCISSNYAGEFGGTLFFGLSQIIDPCGEVIASTDLLKPGMAIADIDIAGGIAHAQTLQGPRLIRDRRPDTYLAARGQIPLEIDG